MKHRGLGKGLSALLKEEVPSVDSAFTKMIDIEKIEPDSTQPRKHFTIEQITELAASIADSGLLHPIIVTPPGANGKHKIIAGERRWRACKIAGFTDIPATVKHLSDAEILKTSLLENIQRADLSVIEEAEAFSRLITEFGYSQEQLATLLSKSRSHITNILRLNQLSQSIKDKVNAGQLTMGHVRCLVGHDHAEAIAEYICVHNLNVRQTEDIVKNWHMSKSSITSTVVLSNDTRQLRSDNSDNMQQELLILAKSLSQKFGMKVTIDNYGNTGKITFHYKTLQQLDTILSRVG